MSRGGAGTGPARGDLEKARALDRFVRLRQNIQSVQETELLPKASAALTNSETCHHMSNGRPFSEL